MSSNILLKYFCHAALFVVLAVLPVSQELLLAESPSPVENAWYDEILFSARAEGVFRRNFKTPIREESSDHNKFYFNSIFLNAEGPLTDSTDFLIEFQPYVADLYLLGGFVSIAEPLEGIAPDEDDDDDPRKEQIARLASSTIRELEGDAERPRAERVQIDYLVSDALGFKVGRVRNPWGYWDDYSLFRNLSALKTDPITLEVQLRRADYGVVSHGRIGSFSYDLGLLTGETVFDEIESNSAKDAVARLDYSFDQLDIGANYYVHDLGEDGGPIHAAGVHWRIRPTYHLSLLGEYIFMHNSVIDVTTKGFYMQANYNLSDALIEGLRWNTFFESYNSDLLKVDLEDDLDYQYAGSILRGSTGLLYAITREVDIGAQVIVGADEEGDDTLEMALKVDVKL